MKRIPMFVALTALAIAGGPSAAIAAEEEDKGRIAVPPPEQPRQVPPTTIDEDTIDRARERTDPAQPGVRRPGDPTRPDPIRNRTRPRVGVEPGATTPNGPDTGGTGQRTNDRVLDGTDMPSGDTGRD